jgi:hypothetical protein
MEKRGFERIPSGIYVARAQLEEEQPVGSLSYASRARRDEDDAALR